jgi:hypothetical protein
MKTFSLTDNQEIKALEIMQRQRKKTRTKDINGLRFGFLFYGTTSKLVVYLHDACTNEDFDISEDK